ncbi:MAG: hypothetical protein KGI58_00195 [Patescibacteria group bacterium]|nr:hypothetical protein [Patescibacteria group bacterium]
MDQTQLQQQISLYFSKLPTNVQQVFSSMTWMETLKEISIKFGLNNDQIETLGTETTLVLLGIVSITDYEQTLAKEINMPHITLEKMFMEINNSILKPISSSLDQTYNEHVESLIEEKYGGLEKLDERFTKLPKEVQEAITESDYQSTLYSIGSKYKLSVSQMGDLEEVTNGVLLGIIHPDKYEDEIKSKLSLPADKTTELVNEINENILKNIREILKSHWGKQEENLSNTDDEVPLPPYAKSDIVKESSTPVSITTPIKESIPVPSPNTQVEISKDESTVDKGKIEKDIFSSKLSGPTVSRPVISDHSLPENSIKKTITSSGKTDLDKPRPDPYHEPIE